MRPEPGAADQIEAANINSTTLSPRPSEAKANARPRKPGMVVAALILSGSTMPVLGSVLIAPNLPAIAAHFHADSNVGILIPMLLVAPALVMGLLAPFIGGILDVFGRKAVLIVSLPLYGVLGVAPAFIESLQAIVLIRLLLGVAEAMAMTAWISLIGDYWAGARRARMLSTQTLVATGSAAFFLAVGGALGEVSWRAPFLIYAFTLALMPLALVLLWEPLKHAEEIDRVETASEGDAMGGFPWRALGVILGWTFCSATGFYVVQTEAAFLLTEANITSPKQAGFAIGVANLATMAGALCFRFLVRLDIRALLAFALFLLGSGLIWLARATSYEEMLAAGALSGFGGGVLLPTCLTWAMTTARLRQRGRAAGGFNAAFFLGQSASPLAIAAIGGVAGTGRAGSVGVAGGLIVGLAVLSVLAPKLAGTPSRLESRESSAQ